MMNSRNLEAEFLTYHQLKENLASQLQLDDCVSLINYFALPKDQSEAILNSGASTENLLSVLEERGVLQPSYVDRLIEAFMDLNISSSCYHLVDFYKRTRKKREFFVQCLQRKIKSWYETMTPVPWRKSCKWSVSDLFVSSGLILTDSKSKRSLLDVDEKCKVESEEIFSHERLKYETRIILEGDPGCGKTMLMSQLAYDWSQGKLNDIKLLIFLPLKFVQQRTLVEAIKEFYLPEDKHLSISDIEKFLDDKDNPAHLLLDGLEEYSGRLKQGKSEVSEIISRKKYPICKVLISSRSDFAKDLPKIPMLKLGKFDEKQRSCYIEKLFPEDSKKQMGMKQIIDESPIIQDLCSVPLLFVLAVHNIGNMGKAQIGQLDRVTPFVKGMVDILCPVTSLITRTQELVLGDQVQKETSLEELAFNGLCRGSQQLYWQKEFFEEKIQSSKEWVDSGVLVIEESSYSVLIDKKDQQAQSADTGASDLSVSRGEDNSQPGLGEVAEGQSDVGIHSQLRAGEDSDKVSGTTASADEDHTATNSDDDVTTTSSDDDDEESVATEEGMSIAKHVPLQVRFLHKIIQEWFAAKYFSSMISRVNLDHLEKYLYEYLPLINPADLHHVLCFTCALYPSSCHIIIKHLLSYRAEEGDVPEYIMNCVILCFAEYTGDYNPNILEALSEICMENIVIHCDDSRLLQQSKVMLLEVASSHGIRIRKLLLADLVVSAKEDVLQFNSGIMMIVSETLEVIEFSRWDQTLKEEDYSNILKFIAKFSVLQKASLKFPDQPPRVDKGTLISLQEKDQTDPATGEWKFLGDTPPGVQKQNIAAGAHPAWYQQTNKLRAEAEISREGGKLEIPNTGVKLDVPPNAFGDDVDHVLLQMKIILPGTFDEPASSFTSNTSTVVEVLPNNLRLKEAVSLTIPHCLELEADRKDGSYTAKIFISHHKAGTPPIWEENSNLLYNLDDTKCTIWLETFCWVKFVINGAIVKGKKIQVYTAGKELVHGDDIVELEVGYYPDLPGGGEILRNNEILILLLKKPFIFLKKGKIPLTLSLQKVVPSSWKPLDLSQEIPFQCIANSEERSCPFVFENENKGPSLPVFVFWISQGDRGFRLSMRPQTEFVTYHQLKENLASQLQLNDCVRLINYFALPKDQSEAILNSGSSTKNLLSVLEERGVLQPSYVDRLIEAFRDLNISLSCYHLVDFFKRTRMQPTSYDKFLAILSAHLIASLPSNLCDYFNISDENKTSIVSSQNPGLSLLMSLDEIGIIKQSEVAALDRPFTEMKLVQAVAMIHEYQSVVEQGQISFLGEIEIADERKREFFVQCLQRKIKSWYETMTPIPWRKSCKWSVSDLFVGSGLILTDSKRKRSLLDVDEKCKVEAKEIFSHERLKYETRIVLEGDPGCGKTMLMSQLAHDWSQGKLNDIKLLIFLPLKFVQQRTLIEAIKEFYLPEDKHLSISDIEKFLDDNDNPAYLLLDGLEEYNGKQKHEKSEIREIISRKKYPCCTVLISSRSDFAKDLPKIPMLKLGKFDEKQRSCYIEKLFPENSKKQVVMKQIIDDSPIIQDLCSVPLLFVLAVHNVENMGKAQIGQLDRVTPFVKGMVDTLCSVESLTAKTQELVLGEQAQKETSLEELAFNGLCRGSQQLYWPKEFFDETIQNSKEWIDSGVLVIEESNYSVQIDKKVKGAQSVDNEATDPSVSRGEDSSQPDLEEVAEGQSDVDIHSQLRDGEGSDKVSVTTTSSDDDDKESVATEVGGSVAKHVPLQVRFLHKIIQEWFAAKYFSSMISRVNLDHLEKYLYEYLLLINPADLHHVLRFTCGLYPSSCHIIIKHLLSHHTEEGDVPEYIMNCVFLCLAEYTSDYNPNVLEVLSEICMEDIMIHCDDSRLLQQSKVMLLEVASSHGVSSILFIRIRKLLLADLVVSAKEDVLQFNSGVMMIVLETLEVIEFSRWDQTLKEEDYSNILKFIAKFPVLRKASLKFPDQPPRVDKGTLVSLQETDRTVMWIIGSKLSQVLDPATGGWKFLGDIPPDVQKQNTRAGAHPALYQQTNKLKAEAEISREGGKLEIPDTGVKLDVPPNAFRDDVDDFLIQIKIILPGTFDEPASSFTSNTSTVVELLPNNLRLKKAVSLTIPHCLELEADHKDGSYTAKIFISHHEIGTPPIWEEKQNLVYSLDDTKCTIWLESFCWVKFVINGAIVKGKKIQVYTAGKELVHGDDIVELEVGYYPDLPGGGEILRNNEILILLLKKPFIFLKKGKIPLTLSLQKVVPSSWKPVDLSQEIPFQCIANSEERSCPFVFENEKKGPSLPVFIFWISQGDRGFRLSMRPQLKGINI
ncbi:Protein NLRC5 [Holothuria leucospilota]|uniref:Protein NLRC5 n=1 Tax=Holothuria leucospilota TaxID=206669 RepID=A0A9Q1H6B3_HOLLE|nr:Protein NLRC5 [Holothuria leucospilota]